MTFRAAQKQSLTALLDLAERCELATRNPRALLEEAWAAVFVGEGGDLNTANWDRDKRTQWHLFSKMLDANALLDAAMTLVPNGCFWAGGDHPDLGAAMTVTNVAGALPQAAKAATPALALCAAALRACAAGAK